MTVSFLLMFAVQCCSRDGFLMLSFSSSPFCRLAPSSHMHVISLVLDPDPLGTYGFFSKWVVNMALRLSKNSPFKSMYAPFSLQPSPRSPCLGFKRRSDSFFAITPLWLFALRFSLTIFADANFVSSALQGCDHRVPTNLLHLHCSTLQLNTVWRFDGILLFPRFSNFLGFIAWFPVVSCFGVTARFTGSSVQPSRPF